MQNHISTKGKRKGKRLYLKAKIRGFYNQNLKSTKTRKKIRLQGNEERKSCRNKKLLNLRLASGVKVNGGAREFVFLTYSFRWVGSVGFARELLDLGLVLSFFGSLSDKIHKIIFLLFSFFLWTKLFSFCSIFNWNSSFN